MAAKSSLLGNEKNQFANYSSADADENVKEFGSVFSQTTKSMAPAVANEKGLSLPYKSMDHEFKINVDLNSNLNSNFGGSPLEWTDLHMSVPDSSNKDERKHILNGISGKAFPGELMEIIGSSGGGKTTALSILGGAYSFDRFLGRHKKCKFSRENEI